MTTRTHPNPLAKVRRVLEAIAPTSHRPMSTGVHEAIVRVFVAPQCPTSKATPRRRS